MEGDVMDQGVPLEIREKVARGSVIPRETLAVDVVGRMFPNFWKRCQAFQRELRAHAKCVESFAGLHQKEDGDPVEGERLYREALTVLASTALRSELQAHMGFTFFLTEARSLMVFRAPLPDTNPFDIEFEGLLKRFPLGIEVLQDAAQRAAKPAEGFAEADAFQMNPARQYDLKVLLAVDVFRWTLERHWNVEFVFQAPDRAACKVAGAYVPAFDEFCTIEAQLKRPGFLP